MPAFDQISQDDHAALDMDLDNFDEDIDSSAMNIPGPGYGSGLCKYCYIQPKIAMAVAGITILGVAIIAVSTIPGGGNPHNNWIPTPVTEDTYASHNLDTRREAMTLNPILLQSNAHYLQKTVGSTYSKLSMNGQDFETDMFVDIEAEIQVGQWHQSEQYGGKKLNVDVTLHNIDVKSSDPVMGDLEVDTKAESGNEKYDAILESMIGKTTSVEVDEDFSIIKADDHETQDLELQQAIDTGTTVGLSSAEQVDQATRLAQVLTDDPIAPGDEWGIEYDTDLPFFGKAVLLGYLMYDGADCAVIQIVGDLDMDELKEKITDLYDAAGDDDIAQDFADLVSLIRYKDGDLETIMFWDIENNFIRYSKTDVTLTAVIPNPLDMDGPKIDVPTEEKFEVFMTSI